MLRRLRILLLMLVLLCVALAAWLERTRSTSWQRPLWVALYPVAADDSDVTLRYRMAIVEHDFEQAQSFLADEARRYGITTEPPFLLRLALPAEEPPPARDVTAGILGNVIWSLSLRFYAWNVARSRDEPTPDISVFLLYHDPARSPALPHSAGLQKGLIGIVHLFASPIMEGANDVILLHELLHTVGATDKYDAATNLPLFPQGYGDPDREPLYPQAYAEIMAGRIPLSASHARTPESLSEVLVGPQTAREIGWLAGER